MTAVHRTHELAVDTLLTSGDNAKLSTGGRVLFANAVDTCAQPRTARSGLYAAPLSGYPQSTGLINTITLIHHHLVGKVAS